VGYGEDEIGFSWIEPVKPLMLGMVDAVQHEEKTDPISSELLDMRTGKLTLEQLNMMLTILPVETSFIDENDEVRYYSDHKHRIFPRSPGAIGRKVQNCHPQKSVSTVNRILESFKNGTKDVAEFWIPFIGKMIHIRYFAVRDEEGNYKGTIEVTQDITDIQKLKGEQRLLSWDIDNPQITN
ncbi:MAG: PAS domain-containing protein, partial [Kangiellaceae bacterium]|nr:PAS domain-containing protein [Kangiellaceae bacterium]